MKREYKSKYDENGRPIKGGISGMFKKYSSELNDGNNNFRNNSSNDEGVKVSENTDEEIIFPNKSNLTEEDLLTFSKMAFIPFIGIIFLFISYITVKGPNSYSNISRVNKNIASAFKLQLFLFIGFHLIDFYNSFF